MPVERYPWIGPDSMVGVVCWESCVALKPGCLCLEDASSELKHPEPPKPQVDRSGSVLHPDFALARAQH